MPSWLEAPAGHPGRALVAGESVEVEADERRLLRLALRLYLPPLAGVLLGPALLRAVGFESGLMPLLAAGLGLVAGLAVARAWTRELPELFVVRRP